MAKWQIGSAELGNTAKGQVWSKWEQLAGVRSPTSHPHSFRIPCFTEAWCRLQATSSLSFMLLLSAISLSSPWAPEISIKPPHRKARLLFQCHHWRHSGKSKPSMNRRWNKTGTGIMALFFLQKPGKNCQERDSPSWIWQKLSVPSVWQNTGEHRGCIYLPNWYLILTRCLAVGI